MMSKYFENICRRNISCAYPGEGGGGGIDFTDSEYEERQASTLSSLINRHHRAFYSVI